MTGASTTPPQASTPPQLATPPRFSISLQSDKAPAEYRELGESVESLGFDGLSVFADLGYQPPMLPLLTIADATSRIRLGTACWNASLLHPVEIAGQIAAVSAASGGRAYLGLTRGAWLGQVGIPRSPGFSRMSEALDVIRLLLSGDDSGYQGRHFTIDPGFRFHYALPEQQPDVLLGVWGPQGAALAARVATEVKLGGCANPDMIALMGSWLTGHAAELGRAPVGVVAGAVTVVDEDRDKARDLARTEVAMYLDVVASMDRTVTVPAEMLAAMRAHLAHGDHERAGAMIDDATLDKFSLSGTPEDIVNQATALVRAGASRVEFGTPHGLSDRGGIELLGTKVLPALRAAFPPVSA